MQVTLFNHTVEIPSRTIFSFADGYLTVQTMENIDPNYKKAKEILDWYRKPHIYSWQPYFSCEYLMAQQSDVMKLFAFVLQNRFNLPNVINFEKNYKALCGATDNFNIYEIDFMGVDALFDKLAKKIKFDTPNKSWKDYAQGLYDAAHYLIGVNFCHGEYLDLVEENPEQVINELCKIKGMGQALARNFLKELGAIQFGKPDVHLLEVAKAVTPTVSSDKDFDKWLIQQAEKARVTPYEFDRIIWLICTGDYFKHHIKISRQHSALREEFIKTLKAAIEAGDVEP